MSIKFAGKLNKNTESGRLCAQFALHIFVDIARKYHLPGIFAHWV